MSREDGAKWHKTAKYLIASKPNGTYRDELQAQTDVANLEAKGWAIHVFASDVNYPGGLRYLFRVLKGAVWSEGPERPKG